QVRPDAAAQPRPAPAHRGRGDHRAAADRRRLGQPAARTGPGGAVSRAMNGAMGDSRVMNVAEAVGAVLAALGVRMAFGVVGSGNFHVTNSLVRHGVRYVGARHEGGAATMADAYARM